MRGQARFYKMFENRKRKARIILKVDDLLFKGTSRVFYYVFGVNPFRVYDFWRKNTKFLNKYKIKLNRFKEIY